MVTYGPTAKLAGISAVLLACFASSITPSVADAKSMCVTKGPRFAVTPAHGGAAIRGNTYYITTMSRGAPRPTCAWAKVAVAKLLRANPPPLAAQQALKGGPRGFSCTGGTGGMIVTPKLAASGHCTKVSANGNGQLFNWGAVDPKLVR